MLQPQGVDQVEGDVYGRDGPEARVQRQAGCEDKDREQDCCDDRRARLELTGGQRPVALDRVQQVLGQVRQVVDDVHESRGQAKQDEAGEDSHQRAQAEELAIEDQGREDKGVLRPLPRAHGLENCSKHRPDDSRKAQAEQERRMGERRWTVDDGRAVRRMGRRVPGPQRSAVGRQRSMVPRPWSVDRGPSSVLRVESSHG